MREARVESSFFSASSFFPGRDRMVPSPIGFKPAPFCSMEPTDLSSATAFFVLTQEKKDRQHIMTAKMRREQRLTAKFFT